MKQTNDLNLELQNQVILVTGASDGLGKVTARDLAGMGATVILVGRNPEKTQMAAEWVRQQTGSQQVDYLLADLSSQAEVHVLANQFQERYARLDVLVNNVGSAFVTRQLSADGIEMTFALNHLSYYLLTLLLLERLKASAPARVVNVSSRGHRGSPLDFKDLQLEHGYNPLKAYNRSKFANILFTYELARRLAGTSVTANALHPGLVSTNIGRNMGWLTGLAWDLLTFLRGGLDVDEGAQTQIYLASSSEVQDVSGKYFDRCQAVPSDPASYDVTAARKLWEISAAMVGM